MWEREKERVAAIVVSAKELAKVLKYLVLVSILYYYTLLRIIRNIAVRVLKRSTLQQSRC